jgi:hypothetical protein
MTMRCRAVPCQGGVLYESGLGGWMDSVGCSHGLRGLRDDSVSGLCCGVGHVNWEGQKGRKLCVSDESIALSGAIF